MSNQISDKYLKGINELITETAQNQRQDFTDENKMMSIYITNPHMQPRECASIFNQKYGSQANGKPYTGDGVIHSFSAMELKNIRLRECIIADCVKAAKILIKSLQNDTAEYINDDFYNLIKGHKHKNRIVLMAMFQMDPQLQSAECREKVFKLNRSFSRDCIYGIISMLNSKEQIVDIKPEEYEAEIIRLSTNLKRSNRMIETLQSEFDEQLEDYKIRNQIDFISKLNSPHYGYILDMLTASQNGFKKLRRNQINLPIEIRSVPVLIRKIIQFVEDCGIEQIAEIGEEINITSADLDKYDYDGTPFKNNKDVKQVIITSTGWEMYEQNIIISKPRVREKENE